METIFYLSLALNIVLLIFIGYKHLQKRQSTKTSISTPKEKDQKSAQTFASAPYPVLNINLRRIASTCENRLPPEDRGLIKILIEKDYPDFPAILKVGHIMLNIKREEKNISQFETSNLYEALVLARNGHHGSGRYLLIPDELRFVLKHYKAINVYLEALGLETINPSNQFWCIDTSSDWYTGWKRFNWSIEHAHIKFKDCFMVIDENGIMCHATQEKPKLLLKLSGWEHLFCEV